ncbi:TetR family transcriptional regulator [Actinoplanes friuliensis DSM 7358]|uniref:TetR family transcriptional regulator n=2 Tax=Actinoplanes friuliensis TaxID=196914 RepID=U5VPS6_9ACTN|nr:TetR family transcriptional regulator [Actinoplanes friuliensis DSM 7358]
MRQEVKDAALRQLAEGGPQALSINAIAKELGVSGPALYRYFAGRDALLTELILDAYTDLTTAISAASRRLPELAAAYRTWAAVHPHRYRLLFGAPLPGYDAHDERLDDALQRMLTVLGAVAVWSRLHGFVSLEIEGNFTSMGVDPDGLFAAEVEALSSAR